MPNKCLQVTDEAFAVSGLEGNPFSLVIVCYIYLIESEKNCVMFRCFIWEDNTVLS